MRLPKILKVLAVAVLVAGTSVVATPAASAAAADPGGVGAVGAVTSPDVLAKPTSMPIARPGVTPAQPRTTGAKTCVETSATRSVCVAPAPPSRQTARTVLAPIPFPSWCASSDGTPVAGTRTEACKITGLILTTQQTVNGTVRITGELLMDVYDYTYGSVSLPNWIHQIGLSPYRGWGDARNSTVTGTLSVSGDCVINGASSFPVQSLAPANNTSRVGEAGARTTATAVGAVGDCTTRWNLRFQPVGYPQATASSEMAEIMCDNAVGANGARPARVGCVVPWYPARVDYSQSRNPSLASHVSRAQASGLPGATITNPLNRNVDTASTNLNRSRACGDAPSIQNMSCDEYPLASTLQGLAFGGTRRTFSGCQINAPTNVTGSSGASACMIAAGDNNAQGGIMSTFYYDYRVLHTDPFRVGIVS
ncbi:hypothetical protein GKC29_25180 [Micromonospora sp. WMMC415]|uniref:NucA/NucB deoxyribonuclease domain-containing protein n=1 Tax=Micromonospora sp. WMMC415 TaxID=2675222 RepID=UPI0012B4BC60|nr:hypothetical protein [Micromonospora sp. WMMC415]QGN49791.1 hypothetical protein GKC29_25180 [Micromonospora sp. WMMC415]